MTSIGSPSPFFLAGKKKVYVVDRSLRFDDDQSSPTRLTRTVQSGGNLKKFTVSFWVKRSQLGNTSYSNSAGNSGQALLHSVGGGNRGVIKFTSADKIQFTQGKDAGGAGNISTTSVFRDVSAWYHICVVADYANSTTADRGKIFVNGVRQEVSTHTNFDNADGKLNTNQIHEIGFNEYGSGYTGSSWWSNFFCGYMAEFYFIDGQAYDPSYFTETNATTGQLVPKEYTGSFGTTGWYLNFSDNTGTTATTLGKDSSSNSNNWTPNGFSTSAGEGNDSVLDTPTTNYCTLNTLDKAAAITFKNGNLQVDNSTTGNYDGFRGTFGSKTGKYYWEIKFPSTGYMDAIGIARADGRIDTNNQPTYRIVLGLGSWYNSYNSGGVATYVNATPSGDYPNVATWSGASNYSSNDIYMIAVDFGAGKIWWGKNNSWFNNSGTANPATGTDPRITFTTGNEWFPYSQSGDSSTSPQAYNFGQQGFAYTPPSGFVALNSANLPDPAILLPDKHFDTKLYTGNGSTGQTITYEFQPDFVWMKNRSGSNNHAAVNTVIGRAKGLYPDVDSGEFNSAAGRDVSAFTSNGFTVGEPEQASSTNNNGSSIVAWAWNAGDTDGKTYVVKVHNFSGNNRYIFDDFQTQAVTLDLAEGGTYIFNMDDASNASHPFSIGTAANGTVYTDASVTYFLDGVSKTYSEYTSGFAAATTRRLHITSLPASAPVLYYWCSAHSGMGGQINTNSTLGSSNFEGNTQATVKVNTTAGFSIISWTAGGTSSGTYDTFGHGLGVRPSVLILKNRSSAGNWNVYNSNFSSANNKILQLSNNVAETTSSNYWGADNTTPSSTLVHVNQANYSSGAGANFIMYAFSEVSSYSKFGSYIGNGSSDGTFVFTGFRPAWVMVKRTDTTNDWPISDNKRNTYNAINYAVYADLSQAEDTNTRYDFLSNGFKIRSNFNESNASGGSYIYLAFAESPFKNARAR